MILQNTGNLPTDMA